MCPNVYIASISDCYEANQSLIVANVYTALYKYKQYRNSAFCFQIAKRMMLHFFLIHVSANQKQPLDESTDSERCH